MQDNTSYQNLMRLLIMYMSTRLLGNALSLGFTLLLLAVLPGMATAAIVKGLYSQAVPVVGQSHQEQADAMSQALANVLVKVAGRHEILSNSVVQTGLDKPEAYIRKFGFHTNELSGNRQQYFQAEFDEKAINQLLRNAGVAIWGQSRPSTLVWLAVEKDGQRSIINASGSFPEIFAESFQDRGLPLVFPLMDFEDTATISTIDVWGGFTRKLLEASRRYGSESILAGRLSRSLSQDYELFYGRLSLIFRGVNHSVVVNGLDSVAVSQLAADLVGTTLSRHYASNTTNTASGKTLLVVKDISSLKDYAALNKYLERMTAIRDASVRRVAGTTVELELVIDGSESQLVDSLALDRNLRAVSPASQRVRGTGAPSTTPSALVYRWIR